MITKNEIFYFESYSYVKCNDNECLIYNTLNKDIVEINDSCIIDFVQEVLKSKNNMYKLTSYDLNKSAIIKFIKLCKEKMIGDTFINNDSQLLPFIYRPETKFHGEDLFTAVNEKILDAINLKSYITELLIYDTDICENNCNYCGVGYLQYNICFQSKNSKWLRSDELLREIESLSIKRITVITVNPEKLIESFNYNSLIKISAIKKMVIHLKNILRLNNKNYELLYNSFEELNIIVDGKCNNLGKDIEQLFAKDNDKKLEISFIVQNKADKKSYDMLAIHKFTEKVKILTLFNGLNREYITSIISYNKNEVINLHNDFHNIFLNGLINSDYFGQLVILPDGTLTTDIINENITYISSKSISELIKKELLEGKLWLNTRAHQKPCSKCNYNELCPPISKIEIYSNKYDYCKKEMKEK
ncbi:MAG: hypothetical protein AB1432_08115 [Bacteroidota bacterium]